MQRRRRGNQGNKERVVYKDVVCAFDIETSTIRDIKQSFMYVWQFQIGLDITIIGRTWDQFLSFIKSLKALCSDNEKFVVYVHNLSYEFQFLAGVYNFSKDEVFAVESRKILKCEMYGCIEFRCAYLHSNMSLSEFTNKLNVQHKKLSGEVFDYSVVRYPWTKLNEYETEYIVNDVLGLVECIYKEMEIDSDNLYTIPLTSTGYVRRDTKRAMKRIPSAYIKSLQPDIEVYKILREAFRGGNCHANRYYSGRTIENVKSADMSSAYPAAIVSCDFPIKPFTYYGECTVEDIKRLIFLRKKAMLMRCRVYGARLKDRFWGCPYLARDKARHIVGGVYDNGRILECEYCEISITDIDLQIILSEYIMDDLQFFDVYVSTYGKLPQPIIDVNIDYFTRKTDLKGVSGQEIYYMKSKNKLNSVYGMMAQDPVKQSVLFIDGVFEDGHEDPAILLDENAKKAFLAYQWGVWVTAWVRYRLEEGIKASGHGFIYCDTDSVKFVGDANFSEINGRRRSLSAKTGAYAKDKSGNTHYMGVYEDDGFYTKFKTLGAKKYVYILEDGSLHVTVAGVAKKAGAVELLEHGGIEAFAPGFVFKKAGGTESVYNDNPEGIIREGENTVPITRNVAIIDSEYTLGITAEYEKLLNDSKLFLTLVDR